MSKKVIIIAVVSLIAVGVGAYMYIKYKKKKEAEASKLAADAAAKTVATSGRPVASTEQAMTMTQAGGSSAAVDRG